MGGVPRGEGTSGSRPTFAFRLLPDRLSLKFSAPASRPRTTKVGISLRGGSIDRWFPCEAAPEGDGDTLELDLAAVVAEYEGSGIIDLWRQVEETGQRVTARRLGRFPRTARESELAETVVAGRSVRLRVNDKGNLVLVLDDAVAPRGFAVEGGSVSHRDGVLAIDLAIVAHDREIRSAELQVAWRQSADSVSTQLLVQADLGRFDDRYGAATYRTEGSLDVGVLLARSGPGETVLDARLVLTDTAGRVQTVRLNERHATQGDLDPAAVTAGDTVFHVVPHYTFLWGGLSLQVDRFTPAAHAALERVMRTPWWAAMARRTLGIWLVGEVPYKAQDNGYHFFRWVRQRHPMRPAFYVIDPDSPDRGRVEALGRVVERGSAKHVYLAACAARLVGTHHADYLLPTTDPRMVRAAGGVRVMLQHGVLGTKNMVTTYGRRGRVRPADVFHVSSPRERDIVVRDLGYEPEQVRVTGLPRFDALLAPAPTPPRGLLVIPTWRSWLPQRNQFDDSDFRLRWQEVFDHPALRRMVDDGERISLILHPNMRNFVDAFDLQGFEVYRQGERAVQDLLREHAALVTDYSSVGFDFALLERPVYYYQFDRSKYFGGAGSHLDLDTELPGKVLFDAESLAETIAAARAEGFLVERQYRERALRFFPAHDRKSTERTYHSVRTARSLSDD